MSSKGSMCSMDKCFLNPLNDIDCDMDPARLNARKSGNSFLDKESHNNLVLFLNINNFNSVSFFDNNVEGFYFSLDLNRNKCVRICRKKVSSYKERYDKVYDYVVFRKFRNLRFLVFGNGKSIHMKFRSEGLTLGRIRMNDAWRAAEAIDGVGDSLSSYWEAAAAGLERVTNVAADAFLVSIKTIIKTICKYAVKIIGVDTIRRLSLWITDFFALFIDVSKYFTITTLVSLLTRFVTLSMRLMFDILPVPTHYRSESADLIALLISLSAPDSFVNVARKLSVLSDPKMFSSKGPIFRVLSLLFQYISGFLKWMSSKFPTFSNFHFLFVKYFSFMKFYEYESALRRVIVAFHKDGGVINSVEYRREVLELYQQMVDDEVVVDMLTTECSITSLRPYFEQFKGIYTSCKKYDVHVRMEPVCIVLEGAAGTGKSRLMNELIKFLKYKNYSTYSHTVPPVDAGKDFWDQYNNQDVTIFDDMGQQGVSQWRSIINLVSPVAYPLDCAKAELKGTKFFNSELILVTTNHFTDLTNFTRADCISEPPALHRRGIVIKVSRPTEDADIGKKCKVQHMRYDYFEPNAREAWKVTIDPGCLVGVTGACPESLIDVEYRSAVPWIYAIIQLYLNRNKRHFGEQNPQNQEDVERSYNDFKTHFELTIPEFKSESLTAFTDMMKRFYEDAKEVMLNFFSESLEIFSNISEALIEGMTSQSVVLFSLLGGGVIFGLYALFHRREEFPPLLFGPSQVSRKDVRSLMVGGHELTFMSESETQEGSFVRNHMRYVRFNYANGPFIETSESYGVVSGKRMIIPMHVWRNNMRCDVSKSLASMRREIYELNQAPVKLIKSFDRLDICIVEFDINHVIYKDGSERMFPDASLTSFNMCSFLNADETRDIPFTNLHINESFDTNKVKFTAGSGFCYDTPTREGLCCSVLFNQVNGVVGFHLAGTGSVGFAVVPSKGDRALLKQFLYSGECRYEIVDFSKDELPSSGLRFKQDDLQSQQPLKETSLIPSELNDLFDDIPHAIRAPPNFSSLGSPAKTMNAMTRKSFIPVPTLLDEEIAFAEKCISQFLPDEFRDITDWEIVKGKDGLSPINPDSVNGYGYGPDKKDYIDFEHGTISSEVEENISKLIQQSIDGNIDPELLMSRDSFKDELRSTKKVNRPRVFRILPLHHMVFLKRCLGDVLVYVKSNMWDNQIAIGMNPYQDWDRLYETFKTKYTKFCDGDVENWDGGANPDIQRLVNRCVLNRYKGPNKVALGVVLESLVTCFVLSARTLYLTTHSMPSGCLVTALFNSLINRAITAITLYRNMKKANIVATVKDFNKIGDFVMGDDKLVGVPESLSQYVNALTFKEVFNSLGMGFTDAKKGEITVPFKALEDCEFLKRKFVPHALLGKVVGALSMDTIIGSLKWTDSRKDKKVVMAGKAIAFQYEMFLHGNGNLILEKDGVQVVVSISKLKERVKKAYDAYGYLYAEMTDEKIMRSMLEEKDLYMRIMELKGKNYF